MSEWDQSKPPPNRSYDSTYVHCREPNMYADNVYPYRVNENMFYAPNFGCYDQRQAPMNASNDRDVANNANAGVSTSAQSHNIVSSSSLTPTAKEFKPRNAYNLDDLNCGAVKKTHHYKNRTQNFDGTSHAYTHWNKNSGNSQTKPSFNRHEGYKGSNHGFYKQKKKTYNNYANVDNSSKDDDVDESQMEGEERQANSLVFSARKDVKNFERYNRKDGQIGRYDKKNDFVKRGQSKNIYYKYDKKFEDVNIASSATHGNWRRSAKEQSEDENENTEQRPLQPNEFKKKLDAGSQRERLQQLLERRLLECLVCCEKLKHTASVWSCRNCYHILHLSCVIRWAKTSKLEAGWRCPACQNVCAAVPDQYRCFCEKTISPRAEVGTLPHSCGNQCGRKPRSCEHICILLCHPGPCPDCNTMVRRTCGCGSTHQTVVCGSDAPVVCLGTCRKVLNCNLHSCSEPCHAGPCAKCDKMVRQECHCGKVGRKVACTVETASDSAYSCGEVCGKKLSCGNHRCKSLCHLGACDPCLMSPELVQTCPCGKTKLTIERTTCLDAVPCCAEVCDKKLKCGQPSAPHRCQQNCHEGECPPCPLTTLVRCRCGHMDKELVCAELKTKADDARCQKKCTKIRTCGKHKCNQMCCIEIEHMCPLSCNRTLTCGLHRCPKTCHRGRCPPCWHTSFQELYCECGANVVFPPVACGTRAPPCNQPCSRLRSCGHEVFHNCHTGPCPPCTVLCKKWCHGRHEQRAAILCDQNDFSCGLPCGKPMSCGRHKCIQSCHLGDCPSPCTQPCVVPRQTCQHPCNQPCHEPPCTENVPCRQVVRVTCQCSLRSSSRSCMELTSEYQSIAMSQIASKMADIQKGQAVDISDLIGGQRKQGLLKTLECNDECRLVDRNRRLAIGLQIRNPDLSAKLTPRYSDFMRGWSKKDPRFCQHVHDKLTELVQLAKQSKQRSRSFSFESMNRDKRHFVHEYCEHFGCDSEAYDAEPNRNVVATAHRDKSWLPSISLLELLQRESGQRKVPGPAVLGKSLAAKPEVVSLKLINSNRPSSKVPLQSPVTECIDYFDDPPT